MSLNEANRQRLMELAKSSIQHGLLTGRPIKINLGAYPAELATPRATFVTLRMNNHSAALRGCIGVLEAIRPLAEDIAENAFSAAFKDPRFPPLEAHELDFLKIHLSILTPAAPVFFSSEQDLLSQLQPGIDGLILRDDRRHGTFLPSVWESLPEPEQFLLNLKQKAGLPPDYWSPNIQIYRYQVEAIE